MAEWMSIDDVHPEPSNSEPRAGKSRIRSIPAFVWLTTLTMFALPLLGTLILPFLLVPDEKHHADMALMAQEGTWIETGWPGLGERRLDPAIVDASLSLGPREEALRENRAAQHPPLFYLGAALTSSVVTIAAATGDLSLHLWSFRLFSVLAAATLPLTFYLIASELSPDRSIRLASALVPLAIPGITLRDGSMINNDTLLLLLSSLAVLYSVRVAKGDLTRKTGILLGLSVGLAALTKGSALVVIPVVAVAYLLHVVRDRRVTGDWLRSVALSATGSLVVGGWWWIRNLVLYGAVQPIRQLEPATPPTLDWIEWLTTAVDRIVKSFWGGQFALGGRSYMPLFWTLTLLSVLACVVGWLRSRDRVAASISGLYALFLILAVFVVSALLYAERGRVSAVHGRYFFPVLAGIAPLMVLGVAGITRRLSRWLPALFTIGATAMTVISLEYMLRRYWLSHGSRWNDQLSGAIGSSPIPEMIATAILALTGAAFLTLLVSAVSMGIKGQQRSLTPDRGRSTSEAYAGPT